MMRKEFFSLDTYFHCISGQLSPFIQNYTFNSVLPGIWEYGNTFLPIIFNKEYKTLSDCATLASSKQKHLDKMPRIRVKILPLRGPNYKLWMKLQSDCHKETASKTDKKKSHRQLRFRQIFLSRK